MLATLPIFLANSITDVPEAHSHENLVVISGSHGGMAAATFALRLPIQGVVFNDAGVGKEQAGIAGIYILERYGVYAAAVDAFSARIGSAEETARGRISFANRHSRSIGIRPGMPAQEGARLMAGALRINANGSQPFHDRPLESHILHQSGSGQRIVVMDSNSMITCENSSDIVLTGSHGGLVGTKPAVKHPVMAVFYNDAGVGKDSAGISRLPWLARAGIVAASVDAATARIGIGMDTYSNGILSHVNALACEMGITPGMQAKAAALELLQRISGHRPMRKDDLWGGT